MGTDGFRLQSLAERTSAACVHKDHVQKSPHLATELPPRSVCEFASFSFTRIPALRASPQHGDPSLMPTSFGKAVLFLE